MTAPLLTTESVMSLMTTELLKPGDVLIEQGSKPALVYVLDEGEIEITRDGKAIMSYTEPGSLFGEVAVLLDEESVVGFRAKTETRVKIVENFEQLCRRDIDSLYSLAQSLARRLVEMDDAFASARNEFERIIDSATSDSEEQRTLKKQVKAAWDKWGDMMRTKLF